MVGATAHADGILVEHTVAGQRLACVEEGRLGCADGAYRPAGVGRDARKPLEEVECGAFRRKQAAPLTPNLGNELARDDRLPFSHAGSEGKLRIDITEDGFGNGKSGNHSRCFRDQSPHERRARGEGGEAGGITGADVLGDSQLNQRFGCGDELLG